jgi:hypothetical protein
MKKIFVKHHLGLGDCIIHNGMIRKTLEDNKDSIVYCSCKNHNYENIKYMYRDSPNIVVLNMDDMETNEHLRTTRYDKIVYPHFDNGSIYDYNKYGDDAFYLKVGMDPKIKKTHFFIDRDLSREKKLYNEIVSKIGSNDYIFIHEKPEENILIDRDKIKNNLPIVTAKPEYSFFDLLYVIEMAKEVHVISSCFLSFFMVKKINKNIFAHMYADRSYLSEMIKKNNIEVIL